MKVVVVVFLVEPPLPLPPPRWCVLAVMTPPTSADSLTTVMRTGECTPGVPEYTTSGTSLSPGARLDGAPGASVGGAADDARSRPTATDGRTMAFGGLAPARRAGVLGGVAV